MPIRWKSSLYELVIKVFELAMENTFRLIYYMLWIPGNAIRELRFSKKEGRRILFAPLGICHRLRGNIFLQPGFQWTIRPIISRNLLTDEACSFAQSIADMKHQPVRAERFVKGLKISKIIEHIEVEPREWITESKSAAI